VSEPDVKPRLPDFLIIGAMKGGSTTLHAYLLRHPDVFLAKPKEPQFFSRDAVYARGLAWYASLFETAAPGQLCGEASTCYSRWPHFGDVPARIFEALPAVKLVYQLRHPVERAYSHYLHLMQERQIRGEEPVYAFHRAVESYPEILDASLYVDQIRQFERFYPATRIHLLTLDDLRTDPRQSLLELQEFLGLRALDLTTQGPVSANVWGDRLARNRMRSRLQRLGALPGAALVARLLPPSWRRRAKRALRRPGVARRVESRALREHRAVLPPMSQTTRAELLERFRRSTDELESRLGRALPEWHA